MDSFLWGALGLLIGVVFGMCLGFQIAGQPSEPESFLESGSERFQRDREAANAAAGLPADNPLLRRQP